MTSRGIHPLLINLVVEKVLFSLKIQDVKNCRFVCHCWSKIGRKFIQSRCKHDVLFGDSTRSKDIEVFTKALKSSPQIHLPFTSFTLQPSAFSLKRSQTLEAFFRCSSHLINTLSLAYQDHSHYLTLEQVSFMTFELPNLIHLRFEVLPKEQCISESTLSASELFRNIYESADNLLRLELILSSDKDVSQTDPYIKTICSKSQGNLGIRELLLNALFNETHLESLIEASYQFKLQSIHFRFKESNFIRKSPLDFFKTQAHHIQKLKIDPWNVSNLEFEEFPEMPYLDTLEVFEWKPYSGSSPLPFTFTYARCFPNLKRLSLSSHIWQEFFTEFFPSCNEIVKSVRELKLPKHIGIDSSMLIRRISNLFPNLIKLEIVISPESLYCLQDIFRLLNNLEDLTISFVNWDGSRCIDYIFTGIPEAICKQIYSVCDVSQVDLSDVHTGPAITELKRLRRLQLRNMSKYCRKGRPQLTDITGYHGLIKLRRLSSLSIWPSQMSKICIHELGKRCNLTIHEF